MMLAAFSVQGQVLIRVQIGNSIAQVANGSTVAVPSTGVNQPRDTTATITYTGTGTLAFPQSPAILGAQDFTLIDPPAPNVVLTPNQSLGVKIRFLPSSSQLALAELDYPFVETIPAVAPQLPQSRSGLIVVGLGGTVPEYSLNYSLPVDGNVVALPAGGTLPFTQTIVNGNTLATLVLVNRGSGTGQVTSVSIAGDAFSLASLPLVPSYIASGATYQFQVRYHPRQSGSDAGTLTLSFDGGASYTVKLAGQAIASYLSYELLPDGGASQPIVPNQILVLPSTAVGSRTTSFIRIRNTSSLDISVSGIAVSGSSFTLDNLPFLPLVLAPGDAQIFSLIFAPAQAGRQTGRLRIGGDSFDLAAEGLGPVLTYSYRNPAGAIPVQPLGSVIFPGAQVGGTATVDFTLKNTGTAPAPLISVGIVSDGKTVFTLSGLPTMPRAVAPEESVTFSIVFAPLADGQSGASLRVNTDAFVLVGVGSRPAPLPDYTIQGPTSVQAFEQPSAGVTLASTYPVTLVGTLTLSAESDSFVADPSVLFSTGSRTATFRIPAGTTRAVFSNGATEIRYQTGSVAGTITLTPSFASEGGMDLTPGNPKTLRATLAASAPKLVNLSVDSRTANGFTLQATGYTTTRSLTKATVSFKGKTGYNFSGTTFSFDLTSSSFLWFTSQASAAFGGQFNVQLPFALSTSDRATDALPPIQAIESVTVTLSNEKGASSSVTVLVQ
jgi:hypothetical protein